MPIPSHQPSPRRPCSFRQHRSLVLPFPSLSSPGKCAFCSRSVDNHPPGAHQEHLIDFWSREYCDVRRRITCDGNEVGGGSWRDRADFASQPEDFRVDCGGGTEDIERGLYSRTRDEFVALAVAQGAEQIGPEPQTDSSSS